MFRAKTTRRNRLLTVVVTIRNVVNDPMRSRLVIINLLVKIKSYEIKETVSVSDAPVLIKGLRLQGDTRKMTGYY